MRLTRNALARLPAGIERPTYDPATVTPGIVHFGPGAFHRAHQAAFVDSLLARDPRWGIVEVSLRSGSVTDALAEQDGLYTLAIRDAEPAIRVIGAVAGVIGPREEAALVTRLADPAVVVVTSTVTEKGYCLGGDAALDFAHADIVHDLARPAYPRSLVGWLVRGLAARRDGGIAPFAVVPCDNLPDNGGLVHRAVVAFAAATDPDLAHWIDGEVRFASTMVDSITPASDADLFERVRQSIGCDDRAAVQRERFAQWVIEDVLPPGGPDLASVGVQLTSDVAGFERAKLRILNGAHSSLAYLGLLREHESVDETMADAVLGDFVRHLIADDVAAYLAVPAGLDLPAYIDAVFARFGNPAIRHRLAQIAIDGSKKLPYRLLDSVAAARAQGHPVDRLLLPLAAWMRWVRNIGDPARIDDPIATDLVAAVRDDDAVARILALRAVFTPALAADADVRAALDRGWRATATPDSLQQGLASGCAL